MRSLFLILCVALAARAVTADGEAGERVIQPGDLLHIRVQTAEAPFTIFDLVSHRGTILLPRLRRLEVAGLSPADAASKIEKAYVRRGVYKEVTARVARAFSFSGSTAGSPYLFVSPAIAGGASDAHAGPWLRLGKGKAPLRVRYTPSEKLGDYWMPGEFERLLEQRFGLPPGRLDGRQTSTPNETP